MENEIPTAIQSLLMKKSPGLDRFTAELYKNLSEDLTLVFFTFLNEAERERALLKPFLEAIMTLIPKPDKDPTKSEKTIIVQSFQ